MWINSFPTLNVQSFPPSFTFLRECTLLPIRESWRSGRIIILTIELHIFSHPGWFYTSLKWDWRLPIFLKLSTALLTQSNRSCSIGCPPCSGAANRLNEQRASSEQPTNAHSKSVQEQPHNTCSTFIQYLFNVSYPTILTLEYTCLRVCHQKTLSNTLSTD